ncbi:DUF308 domain-containing protein [Stenotrophomonas sp. W1S232]|jgi:Uncharacterized conserved protein|uniref:DUF308 domain-containing protein n=1 Tax=Stenotrophomonas koreensis TaxID=266128 RepID=A0A7W3YTY9_9GAMM|nr:DUF308 domain-containing protein [Stenotrophomonas koreensis]MBB1115925.1 DUF308 domain-containing protein [Stenotrophomonas koreensis]
MSLLFSPFVSLLARSWWLLLLRGLLAIAFGLVAFFFPGQTIAAVALLFGAYVLADGLIGIANALGRSQRSTGARWLLALWGVLGIAVGVLTFIEPMRTAMVLILLMALWAVLIGVVQLLAAWRLRQVMPGEWLLAVLGLLSLALGLTLAFSPGAGAVAMLWLIALYALVAGVLMVLLAFKLRRINRRLHTL